MESFSFLALLCSLFCIVASQKYSHGNYHKSIIQEHEHQKIDKNHARFHEFSRFDMNGDHVVDSLEVLHEIATNENETNEVTLEQFTDGVMKEFDMNNDGVVSFSEYLYVDDKQNSNKETYNKIVD